MEFLLDEWDETNYSVQLTNILFFHLLEVVLIFFFL